MEAFPNAKVVLTVRRPETWYTSVSSTIHKGVKMQKTDFAVWLFSQLRRGGKKSMRFLEAIAYTPFAGMDKGRQVHTRGSNPVGPPFPLIFIGILQDFLKSSRRGQRQARSTTRSGWRT